MSSIVAAASMAIGLVPASAQTPLNATFRCPLGSAICDEAVIDAVRGDGTQVTVAGSGTFDLAGYHTFTVGTKGNKTTYRDGAFVNSAGGIDINLVAGETGDRALVLKFGAPAWVESSLPSGCQVAGKTITSTNVDFRFNVQTNDGTLGISAIAPGTTVGPSGFGKPTQLGERWVIGDLNFDIASNVRGFLSFNYGQDATMPWDGNVTLSLSSDGSTYLLTSTSTVLLQCTITPSKGRATTYKATYDMPFQLTVR